VTELQEQCKSRPRYQTKTPGLVFFGSGFFIIAVASRIWFCVKTSFGRVTAADRKVNSPQINAVINPDQIVLGLVN